MVLSGGEGVNDGSREMRDVIVKVTEGISLKHDMKNGKALF